MNMTESVSKKQIYDKLKKIGKKMTTKKDIDALSQIIDSNVARQLGFK